MSTRVGDTVTGTTYGGKRRFTVTVTTAQADPDVVVGLLHYATTLTPGGQYEGSYRGLIALDPETVRSA